MQKKNPNINVTTVKTYTHFLVFTPFPGLILTFPLLCWVLKLVVSFWWWWFGMSCQHLELVAAGNTMFMLMASSSSPLDLHRVVLYVC